MQNFKREAYPRQSSINANPPSNKSTKFLIMHIKIKLRQQVFKVQSFKISKKEIQKKEEIMIKNWFYILFHCITLTFLLLLANAQTTNSTAGTVTKKKVSNEKEFRLLRGSDQSTIENPSTQEYSNTKHRAYSSHRNVGKKTSRSRYNRGRRNSRHHNKVRVRGGNHDNFYDREPNKIATNYARRQVDPPTLSDTAQRKPDSSEQDTNTIYNAATSSLVFRGVRDAISYLNGTITLSWAEPTLLLSGYTSTTLTNQESSQVKYDIFLEKAPYNFTTCNSLDLKNTQPGLQHFATQGSLQHTVTGLQGGEEYAVIVTATFDTMSSESCAFTSLKVSSQDPEIRDDVQIIGPFQSSETLAIDLLDEGLLRFSGNVPFNVTNAAVGTFISGEVSDGSFLRQVLATVTSSNAEVVFETELATPEQLFNRFSFHADFDPGAFDSPSDEASRGLLKLANDIKVDPIDLLKFELEEDVTEFLNSDPDESSSSSSTSSSSSDDDDQCLPTPDNFPFYDDMTVTAELTLSAGFTLNYDFDSSETESLRLFDASLKGRFSAEAGVTVSNEFCLADKEFPIAEKTLEKFKKRITFWVWIIPFVITFEPSAKVEVEASVAVGLQSTASVTVESGMDLNVKKTSDTDWKASVTPLPFEPEPSFEPEASIALEASATLKLTISVLVDELVGVDFSIAAGPEFSGKVVLRADPPLLAEGPLFLDELDINFNIEFPVGVRWRYHWFDDFEEKELFSLFPLEFPIFSLPSVELEGSADLLCTGPNEKEAVLKIVAKEEDSDALISNRLVSGSHKWFIDFGSDNDWTIQDDRTKSVTMRKIVQYGAKVNFPEEIIFISTPQKPTQLLRVLVEEDDMTELFGSILECCTASECAVIYNKNEGDMKCQNGSCINNFPTSTSTISSSGGSTSLSDGADVDFPDGTFPVDTVVTLSKQPTAPLDQAFTELTEVFRTGAPSAHKIHINVDNKVPSDKNVIVSIPAPENGGPEDQAEVFVLMPNSSPEEGPYNIFALFESDHGNTPGTISFELPGYAFSRTPQGKYEAVFTTAPTPGQGSTSGGNPNECQGASIRCPLEHGCEVSSHYGLWTDPNSDEARIHYGVDYLAEEGTPVVAAAEGTIENTSTYDGYGRIIILRHVDGSATLYGHLSSSIVQVGDKVDAGQPIAYAGSSGVSKNAHLHFEYAPNGVLVQTKRRIDPHPCVGIYTSGSIAVGDNGSEADDVFELSIDGIVIGRTFKGQKNNLSLSNLRPGVHELKLQVVEDDYSPGTWEIELEDNIIFSDGTTYKSGRTDLNDYVIFNIVVP